MANDDPRRASAKIEESLSALVAFVLRLSATYFLFWKKPHRALSLLIDDDQISPKFVPPLLFLVAGGFGFALIISQNPTGVTGMVDLIWYAEDIIKASLENASKLFSFTSLIITAFPVFLATVIVSWLLQKFWKHVFGNNEPIYQALVYSAAFQCLSLSIWFGALLLVDDILPGVADESRDSAISQAVDGPLGLIILILAPLGFFGIPALAVVCWRLFQDVRTQWISRIVEAIVGLIMLGVVTAVYVWVAGVPGRLDKRVNPPKKLDANIRTARIEFSKNQLTLNAEVEVFNPLDRGIMIIPTDVSGNLTFGPGQLTRNSPRLTLEPPSRWNQKGTPSTPTFVLPAGGTGLLPIRMAVVSNDVETASLVKLSASSVARAEILLEFNGPANSLDFKAQRSLDTQELFVGHQ